MGLDMYLNVNKYVSGYSFSGAEAQTTYRHILEALGIPESAVDPDTPSLSVDVTVAYWRKANAIHRWFVVTCAEGVDNCEPVYVPHNKLIELRDLAAKALQAYDAGKHDEAAKLLPPQAGFFFGSTDIDDDYRMDLTNTVTQLNRVLEAFPKDDFVYRASW